MDYSKVLKLPQYFRNFQRLSEIVGVLIKHGFGDLINRIHLTPYLSTKLENIIPSFTAKDSLKLDLVVRLRLVFEELGPTFIKFAQVIATRPDIFPNSVIKEFRLLQDEVPSFSASMSKKIIEQELNKKIEDIFLNFEDEPIAAASIAQVHKAQLHSGELVAIKVQRPGLVKIIEADVDILRGFAALVEEHIPESISFSPCKLVEQFARSLKKECDFKREAQSIEQFGKAHENEKLLVIPKVFLEFTTHSILVESFIEGTKVDVFNPHKIDPKLGSELAKTLNNVLLTSVFEHRFFHADPHPGNLVITTDNRIALLDFGSMGRLDQVRLFQILQFLVALLSKDLDKSVRVLKETNIIPNQVDEISLRTEISELLDLYINASLQELDLGKLLGEIFEVVRRYGFRPPPDILLVGKTLTTLEYVGSKIDPDFEPIKSIQPYLVKRYLQLITDPKHHAKQIANTVDAYIKLFGDIPENARSIVKKLANEEFSVQARLSNFPEITRHQNNMINRVIIVLIGVVLIIMGTILRVNLVASLDLTVAYLLITVGAFLLLWAWLAIRKTGGIS